MIGCEWLMAPILVGFGSLAIYAYIQAFQTIRIGEKK